MLSPTPRLARGLPRPAGTTRGGEERSSSEALADALAGVGRVSREATDEAAAREP